ncbi:hypothetical protein BD408DRAFT_439591 [Parasitella parasitica]|nr:hypothetical protein BD408DRAFT_439591 [Parasitella parasitica]
MANAKISYFNAPQNAILHKIFFSRFKHIMYEKSMNGIDAKDETFTIKMEEIMKQVLSSEAFQHKLASGGEFAMKINSDTTIINKEEIKMEPNEKPLFIGDSGSSNSAILSKDTENRYCLRSQSLPRRNSNKHLTKEQTTTIKPIISKPILVEPDFPKSKAPKSTTSVFTLPKGNTNGIILIPWKSVLDSESIHCHTCEIIFNDNFGFRRHLDHVHQHSTEVSDDASRSSSTAKNESPHCLVQRKHACNMKFKKQYRANLKPKHLKSFAFPESYPESPIHVQCRFCKMKGWTESEYRLHLTQSHSLELNPLAKQIADSNIDRIKDIGYAAEPSNILTNVDTLTASLASSASHPSVTDTDIRLLDTSYDPIVDISENQRRTYDFFQTYMLDIS